jgi:TRAP-type mannitol/chloroaromatic compound transport system substrate-binding protein
VAKYYYGPGPQEGGATLECMMNKAKWDALPADLKAIIEYACKATTNDMLSAYTYHDVEAMEKLVKNYGVKINAFPDDVIKALFKTSNEVVAEVGASSPIGQKVYKSYSDFRALRVRFDPYIERGFLNARI